MKQLFTLVILSLSAFISAQSIAEKRAEVFDFDLLNADNTLVLGKLMELGDDLDSLDLVIIGRAELLSIFLIETLDNDEALTYGDIYNKMVLFKQDGGEGYLEGKRRYVVMENFMSRVGSVESWPADRRYLEENGAPSEELDGIEPFFMERFDGVKTYGEILKELEEEPSEDTNDLDDESLLLLMSMELVEDDAQINLAELHQQSIDFGLPIAIYFTGYNCANCDLFEEIVLNDFSILSDIIDGCVYHCAYVDSEEELPAELQTTEEYNGRFYELKTVGDYNAFFLLRNFNVDSEPYIVFLDSDLKLLGAMSYEDTPNNQDFIEKLESIFETYYEDMMIESIDDESEE